MAYFLTLSAQYSRGEWSNGVAIRIGRFLVQTPLGARPGLGKQPRYKAPSDLRVEIVKTQ